ncbi:hypothetical protein EDB86DRAFT_3065094 [Lactarius hatsudake]|nr:hypothetical protein EDB86DRAFT_3065094 [Lactarius hatsudake]
MDLDALKHICSVIDKEMDLVNKTDLLSGITAITPDFIKSWTVLSTCDKAPFLTGILLRAAETSLAKEKNKMKHPDAMCDIIMQQLSYLHSNCILGFPALFGLGYLKLVVKVGSGPHIFVKQQGSSGPAKVTSGTFAILYKHMKLAPILEHFGKAKALNFNRDICPMDQQLWSFQFQLKVVIICVLTTYSTKFQSYMKYLAQQHTEQFLIQVSMIEEATVCGNLLFHDDDLCKHAIPTFNDQLTNLQIQSGQILSARDTSHWTCPEVFQLGFGLFHLCLNLVWALLHVHSLDQTGSLAYFFALLEKTHLGSDHPDYHRLLSALTQILDGILLNAW